jgi:hypothetical protein
MSEPTAHDYAVRIAILETKLHAADEARTLQAKEYERRLQDLNHAHQKAVEERATVVSRELYDSGIREVHVSINQNRELIDIVSAKVNIGIGILLAIQVVAFFMEKFWK